MEQTIPWTANPNGIKKVQGQALQIALPSPYNSYPFMDPLCTLKIMDEKDDKHCSVLVLCRILL